MKYEKREVARLVGQFEAHIGELKKATVAIAEAQKELSFWTEKRNVRFIAEAEETMQRAKALHAQRFTLARAARKNLEVALSGAEPEVARRFAPVLGLWGRAVRSANEQ